MDAPEEILKKPAMAILIVSVCGALTSLGVLLLPVLGISSAGSASTLFFMLEGEDIFNLIVTITLAIISLIFSLVAIIGAIKMRNPQNKAWGYIASLLMIVPTLANCCLIGIPIGIWGIVAVKKSTTT